MKKRLDVLLTEKGLAETRSRAQALINGGFVSDKSGAKLLKPAQKVAEDIELTVTDFGFVSRAALKLDHALKFWNISASDKICLDVGASTGGFTEVLLKNNAAKVYAVDVGHGQLHHSLQGNKQIILLEKTNSKDLNPEIIPDKIDLLVCDVSFISLEKALPAAFKLLAKNAEVVTLIKPQFEVGKENIGEGVVKDEKLHAQVVERVKNWFKSSGFNVIGVCDSPIFGQDGNKEFLIYAACDSTRTTN
jgi:23S rRNA (cytidine1920-2'-O)/16S rRNA (cytidine1409-2'-O)-methyltransferase